MTAASSHPAVIFSEVCLPIVVVIAIGWTLDRVFRIDLKSLIKLNLYVFVPAFIFTRLVASEVTWAKAGAVMGFTLTMIGVMYALSVLIAQVQGMNSERRRAMQLSTMFYNCGNFGIPVTALAFPGTGPVVQAFVLTAMNLSTFTLGIFIASSARSSESGEPAWKRMLPMLKQPSIWAVATAMLIRVLTLEQEVQGIIAVWKPISYIADGLVGVALLTLGVQLSHTRPPALKGPLAWSLLTRLIGGPLAAFFLVRLFGFDEETGKILILGTAAPTAVNTALLAHEFGADSRFAAAAVFYSTLFSAVTVTILLVFLR